MIKNLIIGGGFSAHIFSELLKKDNKEITILTPKGKIVEHNDIKKNKLFEVNKILSSKAFSFLTTKYEKRREIFLHDRVSLGGNSTIWGGVINIEKLPKKFINFLENIKINLVKLSYEETFSKSNTDNLYQLRNFKNKIYDSKDYVKTDIDGFATKIFFHKNKIEVEFYDLISNTTKRIFSEKVFLAISVIQLIEILIKSNIIKDNYFFELDEFKHNFKLSLHNKTHNYIDKRVIIKYSLVGAIKHFLGYQGKLNSNFKYFNKIPLFIEQTYFSEKQTLLFNLQKNIIRFEKINKFGDSIHYSDLKINKKKINDFLQSFSKNLFCISMPSVSQRKPGPISNDIIENIKSII